MISVVIPLYNREALVCETLDSILAQTLTDWECVVVDDHSTDGSAAVVRRYAEQDPRIKLLIRPGDRPKGACACRNFGFERSRGELVYFFDSDDLVSPQLLETLARKMTEDPRAEYGVFPMEQFTDDKNAPCHTSRPFRAERGSLFHQIVGCRVQVHTPNVIWRRALLEKAVAADRLWKETLPCGQESELYARLVGIAGEGTWFDVPAMVHARLHPGSISGKTSRTAERDDNMFRCRASLHDFYSGIGKMTPALHALLLRSLLRFQMISVLISGNGNVSRKYFGEIWSKSKTTPHDLGVASLSLALLVFGPLLRLSIGILNRMGIPLLHRKCDVTKKRNPRTS